MMKPFQVFTLCILCVLTPVLASAVSLQSIQHGDIYYVNEFGENRRAVVRDKANGRVKIQYVGGAIEWVQPSSLLTESQSTSSEVAKGVIGTTVVLGVLYCLANPHEC